MKRLEYAGLDRPEAAPRPILRAQPGLLLVEAIAPALPGGGYEQVAQNRRQREGRGVVVAFLPPVFEAQAQALAEPAGETERAGEGPHPAVQAGGGKRVEIERGIGGVRMGGSMGWPGQPGVAAGPEDRGPGRGAGLCRAGGVVPAHRRTPEE